MSRLVARARERDPLGELTNREREVLALMVQGLNSATLSQALVLRLNTVEGDVRSVFTKLHLEQGEREHRRVLAVIEFLRWQQIHASASLARLRSRAAEVAEASLLAERTRPGARPELPAPDSVV